MNLFGNYQTEVETRTCTRIKDFLDEEELPYDDETVEEIAAEWIGLNLCNILNHSDYSIDKEEVEVYYEEYYKTEEEITNGNK